MHNKRFTNNVSNLVMVVTLVLLAGGLIFMFTSRAQAEGDGNNGTDTVAATSIGTTFTYQGSLEDDGTPVNDTCDFIFDLHEVESGGVIILSRLKENVVVSDGVFTVELDFSNVFTGDARYLAIAVSCPASSGNFVALNGRVSLTATPYALSLRPGAIIQGSVATTSTLQVINSNSSGEAYGVYGQTDSNNFNTAGVLGHATAATGTANGIYGKTDSNAGTGVFGFADAVSGTTSGVYGQVWSDEGIGVYGLGIITGTYGYANANSGTSYGVYGDTKSPNGYGVYSNGNAHVEGDLTWKATTSYLSIPAAALQPNDESILWDISGNGDYLYSDAANTFDYYVVPVYLPHNATITEIKTWWEDGSINDATLIMRRIDPGSTTDMATVSTSGNAGTMLISNEAAITNPVIDNSQYTYVLHVTLPDADIRYYQTVITYTTTGPN